MQRLLQIIFATLFTVLLMDPRLAFGQVTNESSAVPAATAPTGNTVAPIKTRWEKVKDKSGESAKAAYDGTVDTLKEAKATLDATRENRESTKWTVVGEYSLFETWVLSKKALAIAYNDTAEDTYEFEYSTGSLGWGAFGIDIGEIKEQRFSLLSRSHT